MIVLFFLLLCLSLLTILFYFLLRAVKGLASNSDDALHIPHQIHLLDNHLRPDGKVSIDSNRQVEEKAVNDDQSLLLLLFFTSYGAFETEVIVPIIFASAPTLPPFPYHLYHPQTPRDFMFPSTPRAKLDIVTRPRDSRHSSPPRWRNQCALAIAGCQAIIA